MASFGGQQENYSNNPAVESTSKRAESREGSAERKDINGHMQTHALRIAAPATRTATTMFVTNCSGGNEMPVTGATMHWFAQVGVGEDDSNLQASKDREEKLKYARDRQNEERQRKIEELRAQAEAAQRYREQKEEERRRRIEEIRVRDTEKRHQVEERKKAIIEAEKERREYILKKNQERESRIEVKKRDRNSIGFAFGSSTPRLLDVPADYGLVSPSTFWGQRRSTSISNVAGASLSRRSSERELADSGVKKRASSSTDRNDGRAYSMNRLDQLAQPIRRNGEHVRAIMERERRERELEMLDETASLGGGRRSANRGKRAGSAGGISSDGSASATGIMSRSMTHLAGGGAGQRDRGKYSLGGGISSSFRPLGNGQRDSSSRSGNVTPGGHLNNSRPGSAMSNSTTMSSSGYVNRRPTTAPRKPRPASIAGTGMSLEEINKLKKEQRPPMKTTAASPTSSTAQTTPKRTANPMSTSLIVTSSSSRLSSAEKKTPSKREPVAPKPASAPKALPSRTTSSERISRPGRETRTKDTSAAMTKSMIVTNTVTAAAEQNDTAVAKEPNVKEEEKTNAPAAATPAAAAVEPAQSKAEKEALNSVKTEEVAAPQEIVATQPQTVSAEAAQAQAVDPHTMEEKVDVGNEKEAFQQPQQKLPEQQASANSEKKSSRNGSKENSEVRELTPPAANAEGNDLMTASMIAKKITTEEEAKAALAERRRLAREEAERQAELERQRIEAERLAEIKRQEEEAERQRQFEEEATRLAEEQRRGEEERLRKAIEEAKAREEEEQRKRADEERQRIEREEAEKKAKEDAEKQRVEVAERLKREEKEREERRKRVEAIMSRTRKGGAAAGANTGNTPSSTPAKESNATAQASPPAPKDNEASSESVSNSSSSSNSTGSPGSNPPPTEQTPVMPGEVTLSNESQNTQATYEQSVLDKENSLINSFSSMIIDQNAKNLQQFEVTNGKLLVDFNTSSNTTTAAVANGNGHIENVNNKNDINILQDVVTPAATQLIDLSIESQDLHNNPLNINNNNSLLTNTTATTTLVTADSHENKDISLL
ncbi:ensconsin isoform X6 [Scaptodrosophila lebanonensis]|uniref:Ensconsin isoform X6 n=1 Tax=Drosophila lebanonensis TaxID=7225 RepID=A0A6J2TV39_DROLE|nr:ensconsin isoform X6 [Scaptodrosophila lebanonensis]